MTRAVRRVLGTLLFVSMLVLTSCGSTRSYQHCEMILNLPREYERANPKESFKIQGADGVLHSFAMSNADRIDLALTNSNSVVALTRISNDAAIKDGIFPVGSALAFAKIYRDLSAVDAEVYQHGEIPYYTYALTSDIGVDFSFMATFYRTPHAYFVVLYGAVSDVFADMKDSFFSYATSVSFGE